MGLKEKWISQTEIKDCTNLFHEIFRHKKHQLPDVAPQTIQTINLHKGYRGTIGSVINYCNCG